VTLLHRNRGELLSFAASLVFMTEELLKWQNPPLAVAEKFVMLTASLRNLYLQSVWPPAQD